MSGRVEITFSIRVLITNRRNLWEILHTEKKSRKRMGDNALRTKSTKNIGYSIIKYCNTNVGDDGL